MNILPRFVDMANSPADLAENAKPYDLQKHAQPLYPYGLCLCLQDEQLKKLGLDSMPEAGDMIHLQAIGRVTSASENETTEGVKRRVEIQLTHIALADEHDAPEDDSPPEKIDYRKLYKEA